MPKKRIEQDEVKSDFYSYIDSSHIAIIAPFVDEFAYVNRKNFYSMMIIQAICDVNMTFMNVVDKWFGRFTFPLFCKDQRYLKN